MSDWISKTINSKRLQLTKKQFVFHFFFVIAIPAFLIVSVLLFAYWKNIPHNQFLPLKNATLKFASFFSLAYGIVQYTRLQMTEVYCELSNDEFHAVCKDLALLMNWIVEAKGENYIVCTTPFKWYNWGTLVTIVNTGDSVMFNSICDLYNRPATVSFGQNSRNYKALKSAFTIS